MQRLGEFNLCLLNHLFILEAYAMNLGAALASLGKKVLLVDMDPHASLSSS